MEEAIKKWLEAVNRVLNIRTNKENSTEPQPTISGPTKSMSSASTQLLKFTTSSGTPEN